MTSSTFQKLALTFPEAAEEPHFEKTSFRVRKMIFATLAAEKAEAVLKLPLHEQAVFSDASGGAIFSVPNRWGEQGWTAVVLGAVETALLEDALTCAYCAVAPKKLAEQVRGME